MASTDELSGARLLTINCGSSSLKAALFDMEGGERRLLSMTAERIGLDGSSLRIQNGEGATVEAVSPRLPNFTAAIREMFAALQRVGQGVPPAAVGHRVVHGGARYSAPTRVNSTLLDELQRLIPLAPDHLPQAIEAMRGVDQAFAGVPQVACFDTAFHRHMPRIAQLYPLPRALLEGGVERYGFHGLSYEFIMAELRQVAPAEAAGRVIVAHLGNGASIAAVRDGASQDTTMGLTPEGGLVMSTRTGDLDPGVLLYLLEERRMSPRDVRTLVSAQSGLLGVSGASSDVRDLLAREDADLRAAEALELFCYTARKYVGALAAVLGGLDTLVFTGGIGEHAAAIRQRVCEPLGFLGVRLDAARNERSEAIISAEGSPVTVRVIATDEDLMIARHTRDLLART